MRGNAGKLKAAMRAYSSSAVGVRLFMSRNFLFLVLLVISETAHIVSLCDTLGKIKHTAVALADTVVAAHGDVAEGSDLLIGDSVHRPVTFEKPLSALRGRSVSLKITLADTHLYSFCFA